jgi:hypothetical protein
MPLPGYPGVGLFSWSLYKRVTFDAKRLVGPDNYSSRLIAFFCAAVFLAGICLGGLVSVFLVVVDCYV